MAERLVVIVMDGVGIGELPDAAVYGDRGSNTLANTAAAVGGLDVPNLGRMGLGNAALLVAGNGRPVAGVAPSDRPEAAFGAMAERSAGKDTTSGHWELMGLVSEEPFPTYPRGFPAEVIQPFEREIGRRVLGNRAASGTEIIAELGDEHVRTGSPIVYTSADSVFQVAAHEEVIPVEELYRMCETARRLLAGPHSVGRVIARPFVGGSGRYVRTGRRKDFSVPPPGPTLLNRLSEAGWGVVGVGKIEDIFCRSGLTVSFHTTDSSSTLAKVLELVRDAPGTGDRRPVTVVANCVDFDSLWGHRNDPAGMARALEEFDRWLGRIMEAQREGDVLVVTADHGCDPTTPSTDHSREYVPVLIRTRDARARDGAAAGTAAAASRAVGIRESFADLAATLAELARVSPPPDGVSFAAQLRSPAGEGEGALP